MWTLAILWELGYDEYNKNGNLMKQDKMELRNVDIRAPARKYKKSKNAKMHKMIKKYKKCINEEKMWKC